MSDHAARTYNPNDPETWIAEPSGTDEAIAKLREKKWRKPNGPHSGDRIPGYQPQRGRILGGADFMASFVSPDRYCTVTRVLQ